MTAGLDGSRERGPRQRCSLERLPRASVLFVRRLDHPSSPAVLLAPWHRRAGQVIAAAPAADVATFLLPRYAFPLAAMAHTACSPSCRNAAWALPPADPPNTSGSNFAPGCPWEARKDQSACLADQDAYPSSSSACPRSPCCLDAVRGQAGFDLARTRPSDADPWEPRPPRPGRAALPG